MAMNVDHIGRRKDPDFLERRTSLTTAGICESSAASPTASQAKELIMFRWLTNNLLDNLPWILICRRQDWGSAKLLLHSVRRKATEGGFHVRVLS
jgi:hypothetical protein